MRRNEGFTLVELLIVLAVIAALLATITPVALNAVKKAKASQVAQNLRNIKTAIEQYVYTEQATDISNLKDLDHLVSENYLSSNPGSDYHVYLSATNLLSGSAVATVVYEGGDVATDMVLNSYQDAEEIASGVAVDFEIAKYW